MSSPELFLSAIAVLLVLLVSTESPTDCWDGCRSFLYNGTISITSTGLSCRPWPESSPLAGEAAYCRDYEVDGLGQPWCYTTDPYNEYDFCDIPVCSFFCCLEEFSSALYYGTMNNSKSFACQSWSTPVYHWHSFEDMSFPLDGSMSKANNYCRDPDGSGQPWCFTGNLNVRRQTCDIPRCNRLRNRCGRILIDPQGTLIPQFGSSTIPVSCYWKIVAIDSHIVVLNVLSMDIRDSESCLDQFIKVTDGEGKFADKFCGTTPPSTISSTGPRLLVHFFRKGESSATFQASYRHSPATIPFLEILSGNLFRRWFSSRDLDGDGLYDDNDVMVWVFVAPVYHLVQLSIVEIDIEDDPGCEKDFIVVYQGYADGIEMGRMCGSEAPVMMTSQGTVLSMRFQSNHMKTGSGFLATFSTTLRASEISCFDLLPDCLVTAKGLCYRHANSSLTKFYSEQCRRFCGLCNDFHFDYAGTDFYLRDEGLLVSEKLPTQTWGHCGCSWLLYRYPGHYLQLTIVKFHLGPIELCRYSHLKIIDEQHKRTIGSYCGTFIPPAMVIPSNAVVFKLTATGDLDLQFHMLAVFVWTRIEDFYSQASVSEPFPDGDYALPMPQVGCGDGGSVDWEYGYINISFRWPVGYYSRRPLGDYKQTPVSLPGPYSPWSLQLNFCTRSTNTSTASIGSENSRWPGGLYSIFGTKEGCPDGFTGRNVTRSLPPIHHVNKDGYLPHVEVQSSATESNFVFLLCDQTNNNNNNNNTYIPYPYIVIREKQNTNQTSGFMQAWTEDVFLKSRDPSGTIHEYDLFQYEQNFRRSDLYLRRPQPDFTKKYAPFELTVPDIYSVDNQIKYTYPGQWMTSADTVPDWLLYDLGQSLYTPVFRFSKIIAPPNLDAQQADIPQILISEMKWSFLSGGAITCNSMSSIQRFKSRLDVHCMNDKKAFSGRYVMIFAVIRDWRNVLSYVFRRTWRLEIISAEKSTRCNQRLGMTGGTIKDFQITASSEHPDYPATHGRQFGGGWCALPEDHKPYLQIDLFISTQVEGITIFNWKEVNVMHSDWEISSYQRGMGVYNFTLGYSLNNLKPENYLKTQVFHVDLNLQTDISQTFQFVTPFQARFIRVNPLEKLDAAGLMCLKLELIGCVRLGQLSPTCSRSDSTGEWISITDLHVAILPSVGNILKDVESPQSCIELCEDWSKYCMSIVYDPRDKTCYWYKESTNQNYRNISITKPLIGMTKICQSVLQKKVQPCVDTSVSVTYCDEVANMGACNAEGDTYYKLKLNCRKTCDYCSSQECGDLYSGCPFNAERGFCDISYQVAEWHLLCSQSCGLCGDYGSETDVAELYLPEDQTSREMTTHIYSFSREMTTHIYSFSPFVSDGYPFHYTQGMLWTWDILFFRHEYANLIFTNISFNIYQVNSEIPKKWQSYSDKIDRLYIVSYDDHNKYDIFKDTLINGVCMSPSMCLEWDALVIDNSFNGQLVHLKSSTNVQRLIMRTWDHEAPIQRAGTGFRAIAYPTNIAYCSTESEDCTYPKGTIQSQPNFGELRESIRTLWVVRTSALDLLFIKLQFTYFDVGCTSVTSLKIVNSLGQQESYCNLNRTLGAVYSDGPKLTIELQHNKPENSLQEWFTAEYSTQYFVPEGQEDLIYEFCPDFLDKCLMFIRLTNDSSWNQFKGQVCEMNGWSMVSIHSEVEQNLIGISLLRLFFKNFDEDVPTTQLAFIGLQKEILVDEKYRYKWNGNSQNESPVTFKSWAKGMPSRTSGKDCTILRYKTNLQHSWESIFCHAILFTKFGVCEVTMKPTNESFADNAEGEVPGIIGNDTSPHLIMPDMSSYFPCISGEIISILGRCDGRIDCFYGDDEMNCDDSETCKSDQFRCDDNTCISLNIVCDYRRDCLNGADENCYFIPCGEDEFECRNKKCIKKSMNCDTKDDCFDGSDEELCEETRCNDGSSFLCAGTCLAHSYVCDGEPDCLDGSDEEEKLCQKHKKYPASCLDWYSAGYNESGIYKIYGIEMECDFHTTSWNGQIVTKYHYIDYERHISTGFGDPRNPLKTNKLIYQNTNSLIQIFKDSWLCVHSVDQLCEPSRQFLFDVDVDSELQHEHICYCLSHTIKSYRNAEHLAAFAEPCRSEKEIVSKRGSFLHDGPYFTVELDETYGYIIMFSISSVEMFLSGVLRIRLSPVVCLTETEGDIEPVIPCGGGYKTTLEARCLYDQDKFGHVIGCRSLAHLQNCADFVCPDGYFKCNRCFCLENRFVCDGEDHCEHGEDEYNCDGLICASQYRCLSSTTCLGQQYLCDGYQHCPHGDDEQLCYFRCPAVCSCVGQFVDCTAEIDTDALATNDTLLALSTRLLDFSENPKLLQAFRLSTKILTYLLHLNISKCGIAKLVPTLFTPMKNLRTLDVGNNRLRILQTSLFKRLNYLETLNLAGNQQMLSIEFEAFVGLVSIRSIILSSLRLGTISENAFSSLDVILVDLSFTSIDTIEINAFTNLQTEWLNLSGSVVTSFSKEMFHGAHILDTLVSNSYIYCCVKPPTLSEENCFPPKGDFSSCSNLLDNDALRPLIWISGLLAIICNSCAIFYRFLFNQKTLTIPFGIFVSNLAFSDFLMGVYLLIIASADAAYGQVYMFDHEIWKSSIWCSLAGILSMWSVKSSAMFLCLICIDRIFVIKYPYGEIRFTKVKCGVLSSIVWAIAGTVAFAPVIYELTTKDSFYSKTSICMALPLTNHRPSGWQYPLAIYSTMNWIMICLIVLAHWFILKERHTLKIHLAGKWTVRSNDLKITTNILWMVILDFVCWLPVGLVGLLMTDNEEIHGDIYAWTALIIVPIKALLNPVLFTLLTIVQPQRFLPDTEEQARPKLYTEAQFENIVKIWTNTRFCKVGMASQKLVPLKQILKCQRMSCKYYIKLAYGLVKCLMSMHELGLIQANFTIDDVLVEVTPSAQVRLFLKCRPKLLKREAEKAANIEVFGNALSKMIYKTE